MKQLLTLPSWIVTGFIKPFLKKNHPWKKRKFSLKEWSDGSTELNDALSLIMWVGFLECMTILFIIYK